MEILCHVFSFYVFVKLFTENGKEQRNHILFGRFGCK